MVLLGTLYEDSLKIEEMKEVWGKYKGFLMEKYPAEEGNEWEFTCEHHKRIDAVLNKNKDEK